MILTSPILLAVAVPGTLISVSSARQPGLPVQLHAGESPVSAPLTSHKTRLFSFFRFLQTRAINTCHRRVVTKFRGNFHNVHTQDSIMTQF